MRPSKHERRVRDPRGPARCDVVLEQTLGHVTHGDNLRQLLGKSPDVDPTFHLVPFEAGTARWIPGYGNWTVRAGLRARRMMRGRNDCADVRFVHTQVPAVLLGRLMRSTPTVVSLDATPRQYDELGGHYQHDVGPSWVEALKHRLHRRCLRDAAHLVVWSEWTKNGLVREYGVDPGDVTVIPPGVDVARWSDVPSTRDADDVVRVLFVGADLERKGGRDLTRAFAEIRTRYGERVELHLVTKTPHLPGPGVVVHHEMTPNSPELIELYGRCDIFCLPTLGDCLPMVLPEAGVAGLALVSTDVGAISEVVRPGESGVLVGVADVPALTAALDRLVTDDALRLRLAQAARKLVIRDHDAATNALRLGALLRHVAQGGRVRL